MFPSRKLLTGSGAVARAVRSVPYESRFDILDSQRIKPKYCSEGRGTPRRCYQENLIEGIRIAPTFNPYVKLNKAKRYVLDNWASRNWSDWDPRRCYVRGSRRRYNVPEDILPYKDELGEWHPPKLSGRYQADIEKQYRMNGLPWVWDKDFYTGKMHFHDSEPMGPKTWYRKEYKEERIKEAMKTMDETVMKHKKEVRAKKRYCWLETQVKAMARPAQVKTGKFFAPRIVPKL
eukprot:GHVS01015897.1.p1 GENE.GHVS01015897.1~~GHVS01015897.1.p1  ORF type:complete len:233 (+),score=7.60 GHVS01015897.1:204-902(+)